MSEAKAIRKQVRNVVQEVLPELMKSSVVEQLSKELQDTINKRLDGMNQYCVDQLMKQDKRARDVQGFLMREVKTSIRDSLSDMDVTIEAVIKVLAQSGVVIESFVEKVSALKPEIVKEREEEAKAKMEAQLKAQQESAEKDKADEEALAAKESSPAEQSSEPTAPIQS